MPIKTSVRVYSQDYINSLFYKWYNNNKPNAKHLEKLLVDDETDLFLGSKPSVSVLSDWINKYYEPRALELDTKVRQDIDAKVTEAKVRMLERHADLGVEMQDIAIEYLRENKDKLSANAAVRLLVAGIETERASRGIPDALTKISKMSDQQILEEMKKLVEDSPSLLLPEDVTDALL